MNWAVTFYAAILFFVLTPAVLVRLPPKGGKFTVAAVHALVFALIFHFTHKFVWQLSMGMGMPRPVRKEGMQEGNEDETSLTEEERKKKEENKMQTE
jgi:hypothetical protein